MAGEGTFTNADGESRSAAPINVAIRSSSTGDESGDRIDGNTDCARPSSVGNRRGSSVAESSAGDSSFTQQFESRKGGKKMIIFNLFMFQGRKEVRVRVHERSEATKDRHAMMQMVIGSATGYFNMKKDERESSRRERKRRAKRRRRSSSQLEGGAISDTSCSSDSNHSA